MHQSNRFYMNILSQDINILARLLYYAIISACKSNSILSPFFCPHFFLPIYFSAFFFYFLLWIRVQEDTMAWKVIFVLILYFMEFIEVILFSSKSFLWQCTHNLLQLDHDISFSLCLFGTALISPILFSTTQKNSQKTPNLRSCRTNSQAQHKHLQPQ